MSLSPYFSTNVIIKIPESGYYFLTKKCFAHGILPILTRNAYPRPLQTSKGEYRNQKTSCLLYGKAHGTLVHSTVEQIIKHVQITTYIDPCVYKIFDFLNEVMWTPYLSEFIVYDENTNVATAIDLIVYDINRNFIAIEIKTGYENEDYTKDSGCMSGNFYGIPDNYLNRHKIQLLTGVYLFEKNGHQFSIKDCYIIRTCPKKGCVNVYQVERNAYIMNAIAVTFS